MQIVLFKRLQALHRHSLTDFLRLLPAYILGLLLAIGGGLFGQYFRELNPSALDLTRELLEGSGYKVLEAADGKQAIEIADLYDGNIALLLTDVVMPKIGGLALAKSLRQRRSGMKILYMSGYANGAIFDSGVLKPGTAFVHKPLTAKELAKKVRELLDAPQYDS